MRSGGHLKLGERIDAVAQLYPRPSRQNAAAAAGVSTDALQKWIKEVNEPALPAIGALCRGVGASIEWVATGDGSMMLAISPPLELREPHAGYAHIPLYDVRAQGGARGRLVESERVIDALAFKEDWIRQELRVKPGDLRLIYVEGDSMEPDLRAGDIILIDHTDTSARREGVYVIRMDGALLVKQLQRLPGGILKVLSRNEAYEPWSIEINKLEGNNEIAIIGRVVWACRRL